MKTNLTLPKTAQCNVVYTRGNVTYGCLITTPVSIDALQVTMLGRQVGMSAITRVEPVQSFKLDRMRHIRSNTDAKYLALQA